MTTGYRVEASGFVSAGVRCGADLYLPEQAQNPSLVLMAHGFGAERTFRLPAYAAHFARNGIAVLLFDYRTFGDSEGTPRNLVDPDRHVADWKTAMNTPESLPGMLSIVPNEADWQNRVCTRILFKFPMYRPLRFASRVKCPTLLMLAENDSLVTPASIRSAAKRMTNARVIAYPFGHFDINDGEAFNDAIAKQTGFLIQHLQS